MLRCRELTRLIFCPVRLLSRSIAVRMFIGSACGKVRRNVQVEEEEGGKSTSFLSALERDGEV